MILRLGLEVAKEALFELDYKLFKDNFQRDFVER